MWQSFLFFVDTGGVESELKSPITCGGNSQGLWEVRVMESNIVALDFCAHAISMLAGSNLFAFRKIAGGRHFSHFCPSVSSNRRNCRNIEDDGRSAFDSCPASPCGLMGITARDAHSSRPLLFETCSTIFVNN
jgi:hypothetical protein